MMRLDNLRATVGKWADFLSLSEKYILPLFTLQWGCGAVDRPNLRNVNGSIGHGKHDASLFYNGIFFGRVVMAWSMLPVVCLLHFFVSLLFPLSIWWFIPLVFGAGIHVRWSAKPSLFGREFLQVWIGYKKNGDFALTQREQTDESAAAGTYGHNYGQAQGWSCGTH